MEMEASLNNDELSFEALTNKKLIESYEEIAAFLKIVEEEIKKTDVGDSDE
jgi:hypothetical protein